MTTAHRKFFGFLVLFISLGLLGAEDDFLYDTFNDGFQWGTATSAYQIEGGWNANGKGESNWDKFCHEGGHVKNNDTGDVACDSYNKYADDIAILKNLGVNFYRFSMSWPRILPNGTLPVNPDGILYYNALIDGLLAEGIQPMVTLFHWDTPQALEDIGGWLNPEIVRYFKQYATVCYENFGDRVKLWLTLNEPWVASWLGYGTGGNAPGIKQPEEGAYRAAHHMILAHAEAWHTYDTVFRKTQNGKISITLDSGWEEPYSNKPEDIAAAERAMQFKLGWFANPIYVDGDYPGVMKEYVFNKSRAEGRNASRLPEFTQAQKIRILGTHDFFGLNHYTTALTEHFVHPTNDCPGWECDRDVRSHTDPEWPISGSDWLFEVPWGMRKVLGWIKDKYGNPAVMITENGVSDDPEHHGSLNDQQRIRFYTGYINNVLKAIKLDGCHVAGYTAWSVMDNFEWGLGYSATFGLHHIDFSDPQRARVAKESAKFYKELITNNGWLATISPASMASIPHWLIYPTQCVLLILSQIYLV